MEDNAVKEAAENEKVVLTVVEKKQTEETTKMKESFSFFGPVTAAYALFYAFCMYKNNSGITFPFFMAGSLLYFCYSMKKLGLTLKRNGAFYMISVMLLAVSTFCTGDERIISFNQLGIFLLMISFLLTQFYETGKWGLGKFLSAIPELCFGCLGEIASPIQDGIRYGIKNQSSEKKKILYVILGLVITVPLFLIVAALLSSADVVFRQVTDAILTAINFENIFGIIFSIVIWYFAAYTLVANLCNKNIKEAVTDHRNGEPILAITVTVMLSLLYLYFCWIQVFYLFLGKMQLPEGYTYSEYAREGFFQLLAVAILNLIIVLFCLAFFRESKVLKGILTVMSLCTFVMIASSAMRMILYIQIYNLTFLRILVLWGLAVLTFLFVGVLLCIFKPDFPLFRYSMVVVTCFYVVLAFSHPDLIIAKVNLENKGGKLDYKYLADLSTDAAPVLIPYLEELGYDLSIVDISLSKDDEKTVRNDRSEAENTYWSTVVKRLNGDKLGRTIPQSFGYYYLEKVRDAKEELDLRTFNLSRYIAVKMASTNARTNAQ